MIIYELLETENHKAYQDLSIDNLERQYDFLRSLVNAALDLERPMISTAVTLALNFHAIACLHVNAGQFRPCPVTVGSYTPPPEYRVPELMNNFVNEVNRFWEHADAIALGAYVLWRLNHIHPFINGNGRTARALCYYVICLKSGGWLAGSTILPELIRRDRDQYVRLLQEADQKFTKGEPNFLQGLYDFLRALVDEQIHTA